MTDSQLKELKKLANDELAMCRQALIMDYPFVGGILMQLNVYPVRDGRCDTAWTNGKDVYFDLEFFSVLTPEERKFILAHEAWHCIFMHMLRLQGRDMNIFNIATDMEINRLLQNDSSHTHVIAPKGVLFPKPGWNDLSAEQMYELLIKEAKKNKNTNSGGSTKMMSGSNSGKSSSKNPKDRLSGQFDKHTYDEQDAESPKSGRVDKWGEVGQDPDFNPVIDPNVGEQIREMVIAEAERCQRTAGGVPAAIEQYLEKLRTPEISWKEVLAQFVTSCYNGTRRWLPPARRHVYNGIYLQSRRDEKLKVAVAVDTSGSCIGDLPKFFGELTGLLNSFGNYELTLIQNDYDISSVDEYSQDNPFPDDPSKIKWTGGGGTSFKPPFEWIEKNGKEVDCFIFFTDGEEYFADDVNSKGNEYPAPPYPVLWILTKDGNENCCPWGQKIKFKNMD